MLRTQLLLFALDIPLALSLRVQNMGTYNVTLHTRLSCHFSIMSSRKCKYWSDIQNECFLMNRIWISLNTVELLACFMSSIFERKYHRNYTNVSSCIASETIHFAGNVTGCGRHFPSFHFPLFGLQGFFRSVCSNWHIDRRFVMCVYYVSAKLSVYILVLYTHVYMFVWIQKNGACALCINTHLLFNRDRAYWTYIVWIQDVYWAIWIQDMYGFWQFYDFKE